MLLFFSGLFFKVTELVHSWAPLVWLHGEEQFAPSSVDFFLRHVTLQNRKGRVIDGQPAPETLPSGAETEPLNLQTREKLGKKPPLSARPRRSFQPFP